MHIALFLLQDMHTYQVDHFCFEPCFCSSYGYEVTEYKLSRTSLLLILGICLTLPSTDNWYPIGRIAKKLCRTFL